LLLNKVKTNKVTAVLGIAPGYETPNFPYLEEIFMVRFISKKYQEIAEKNFQEYKKETGKELYVSAVFSKSNTAYRTEWGCPDAGESTITIECTRNPKFIDDGDLYNEMATKNIMDLKEYLNQCTVLIEYSELECMYIFE
jgi:hypothetical protein